MYLVLKNVCNVIILLLIVPSLIYNIEVHGVLHKAPQWAITTRNTQSTSKPTEPIRRQGEDEQNIPDNFKPPEGQIGPQGGDPQQQANRFTQKETTVYVRRRTTQEHLSLEEYCDYILHFCLRAYQTGKICAKSVYFNYFSFKSYCMLDWANCILRYAMWQIIHMGECAYLPPRDEVVYYDYNEDHLMDQYFVPERE